MTSPPSSLARLRSRASRTAVAAVRLSDRIAGRAGSSEAALRTIAPLLQHRPQPSDRGAAALRRAPSGGPIIASGRFRAGTTLLWNLFRQHGDTTAYYEPFNPRRWFDPAARGAVDPSHRGVANYWHEYDGMVDLAPLFRERWHDRNLMMGADARDPAMERYVRALIERAPRRPVLQFNRIDFRLPWYRARFPEATIVHLQRNPRDQWCSTLLDPDHCPRDVDGDRFAAHDHFYLRLWVSQLAGSFPFLSSGYAAHPYRAHYMIWRLSQAFGLSYADWSLRYEDLAVEPRATLEAMFAATGLDASPVAGLAALIESAKIGRWMEWASEDWFAAHEEGADRALAEFAANCTGGRR